MNTAETFELHEIHSKTSQQKKDWVKNSFISKGVRFWNSLPGYIRNKYMDKDTFRDTT